MQHTLQISRKVDYALRAMIYLASIPPDEIVPFREIARRMDTPQEFLAKILKRLANQGLVRATRGARGVARWLVGPVVPTAGTVARVHATQACREDTEHWQVGHRRQLD